MARSSPTTARIPEEETSLPATERSASTLDEPIDPASTLDDVVVRPDVDAGADAGFAGTGALGGKVEVPADEPVADARDGIGDLSLGPSGKVAEPPGSSYEPPTDPRGSDLPGQVDSSFDVRSDFGAGAIGGPGTSEGIGYDTVPDTESTWQPPDNDAGVEGATGDGFFGGFFGSVFGKIQEDRFQQAYDGGGAGAVKDLLDAVLRSDAPDSVKEDAADKAAKVVEEGKEQPTDQGSSDGGGATSGGSGSGPAEGEGAPPDPEGTDGTTGDYGEGYTDPASWGDPTDDYAWQVKFANATGGDVDYGDQLHGHPSGTPTVDHSSHVDYGEDYVPPDYEDLDPAMVRGDSGDVDPSEG